MRYALIPLIAILAAGCANTIAHITAPAECHARGSGAYALPDPKCTPGATNPVVTQQNIHSTICVAGWTRTVRPPVSYTSRLKRRQMIQYGFTDSIRDHEEDHLVALSLGGASRDPRNLWPQPGASPNVKDRIEGALRANVCSGKLALRDAQRRIATNWITSDTP